MQTFLPYPDYDESARCLDRARAGKQRPEVLQLLQARAAIIADPTAKPAWCNHPATRMWAGHEFALYRYGVAVCREWVGRGYEDNCMRKLHDLAAAMDLGNANPLPPPWLGDPALHSAYRSLLLRKGIEDETFARHKGKPELPARKSLWKPQHYKLAWERYGKPAIAETHYGQFGWSEPADLPFSWPV